MADISLHFSSKAPLAGTFDTLNRITTEWRRRNRDRRDLAQLTSRDLHDLGLSTSQAEFEINKPFWRA
jgi:uncharacterized protein YjiS (DUF1127 family)